MQPKKYSIGANEEAIVVQPGESATADHSKNINSDSSNATEPSTDIASKRADTKKANGMSKKQKKKWHDQCTTVIKLTHAIVRLLSNLKLCLFARAVSFGIIFPESFMVPLQMV